MSRFFNPVSGGHFFTADTVENNAVVEADVFNSEGIGFEALSRDAETVFGSIPIYRFFNVNLGSHFFTGFEEEKNHVLQLTDYVFEVLVLERFNDKSSSTLAIHRFFNTETGGHFFTADEVERDSVMSLAGFHMGEAFLCFSGRRRLGLRKTSIFLGKILSCNLSKMKRFWTFSDLYSKLLTIN